jgi:hypothetical protein
MSGSGEDAGEESGADGDKHEPAENRHEAGLVTGEACRVARFVCRVMKHLDMRKADTPYQDRSEQRGEHRRGDRTYPGGGL